MEYKEVHHLPHCDFNFGVACDPKNRTCSTCGWNPEVEKARLDRLQGVTGAEIPTEESEKE